MAHAPGYLDDLDAAGIRAWAAYLSRNITTESRALARTAAFGRRPPAIVADGSPNLGGIAGVDWSGEPNRALQALPHVHPLELGRFFDWTSEAGAVGRAYVQEEYLEWRSVYEGGELARVELTCETPDYWAHMAGRNPNRAIALAAEFSGEAPGDVDVVDLFGMDPARARSAAALTASFRARNGSEWGKPALGGYNNGTKSILHMAQGANSAWAAIALALRAAYPFSTVSGGAERALDGGEAIASTEQSAVPCRNSDPTIVGVLIAAAFRGLQVALVEPFGIYMLPFDRGAVTLDGDELPEDWLSYGRGRPAADNPTGQQLHQRLVVAPPAGSGKRMSDLLDTNGDPVETGNQIAREQHVQILYRARQGDGRPTLPIVGAPRRNVCGPNGSYAGDFALAYRQYQAAQGGDTNLPTRRD